MSPVPRTRRRPDGSPSARALLFTVLGEYVRYPGRDRVWSVTVVAALGALGVEETTARRTVTRLVHEGWLTAEPQGRYTQLVLTARLMRLLRRWTERLRRATEDTPWHGEFPVLLLRLANEHRPVRAELEERLTFEGFGPLGRGAWLAADPGGKEAVRETLAELGVAERAVLLASRVELPDVPALFGQVWDLDAVRPLHEEFMARFEGLRPATDEEAFVVRTQLVHAWRLTFHRDPRLPSRFLPAGWPGLAATALFVRNWLEWHEAAERYWDGLWPVRP
ncbi:PaaX family transcriptional regulator [Streptomyces iconiensis]|uniref:PaaX family transcriptional regulator C-terminal domain-containing protein n=1 Tax=Streptomyces iconiensis TaxID=1384038 RepID=A0ABT7A3N2_9ACTN|nr:PaaX family transcriptional regulator C-terminal domain-containing protein [Streptomyces iconiensis]MDJ1135886.1 PaaX family transcriptional regulator C-terminal domain-containing protein [Streptomyces iconiensis]